MPYKNKIVSIPSRNTAIKARLKIPKPNLSFEIDKYHLKIMGLDF